MKVPEDGDEGRGDVATSREPPEAGGAGGAGSILPWSLQRAVASDTMMSGLLALELVKVPLLCSPRI